MKKFVFMLAMLLAICTTVSAQGYTRNGKTFTQTATAKSKSEPTKTEFTWKDKEGVDYPIYISDNGSCFVLKKSKKSGNEYRKYLGEQISKEICAELGREYTYKPKEKKK